MLSESESVSHLERILYPGSQRDIMALGLIRHIRVEGGNVLLHFRSSSASEEVLRLLTGKINALLKEIPEVKHIEVHGGVGYGEPAERVMPDTYFMGYSLIIQHAQ